MIKFSLVFLGGGIGSIARYWLSGFVMQSFERDFPLGTVAVNVIGCFLIGVIAVLAEERALITPEWRLLLTVGFCGGFTTFSTFTLETLALARGGEMLFVMLYAGGSVLAGLAATWLGGTVGALI